MNADILPLRAPEALRRRLAAVPAFDPPAWLDARVQATLAQAPPRRRISWPAAAVAAVLLVAVALAWRAPEPREASNEAAWLERSRTLESELARLRLASDAPDGAFGLEAELARIDRALQAAYDRGAPQAELAPLWQQRSDTLDSLVTTWRRRDHVVRI
jgi:hypothetical protein